MRPVRLLMQAFGPYAESQELRMEDLGETGIYAITGETGAGKTTIFDAIVYALYGSGSGEDRKEGRALRSVAAQPDLETKVELDFVSGGRFYSIVRKPEQFLTGRRKNEPIKKPASQVLTMDGGKRVLTRSSEIEEAIGKEILGVTRDQFCQIVMIAQGEFRKLLQADTKDRTVILRRIFRTDRYEALSRRMEAVCRDKQAEWMKALAQASFSLKNLQADPASALFAPLAELRVADPKVLPLESALNLANRIGEEDEAAALSAKHALEGAGQLRDSLRKAVERETLLAEKRKSLESLREEQARQRQALEAAGQQLEAARQRRPEIERLEQEIAAETRLLDDYQKLEELESSQKKTADALSSVRLRKDGLLQHIETLNVRRASLCREAEAKKGAADRLLQASSRLNEASSEGKRLESVQQRLQSRDQAEHSLRGCEAALEKALRGEQAAADTLSGLEKELLELGNTEMEVRLLEKRQQELEAAAQGVSSLASLHQSFLAALGSCEKARKLFTVKEETWQRLNADARRLRSHLNANIAGILARDLAEGDPCPVCGSTHHPGKAALAGEDISETAVKEAEEAAENARAAFDAQAGNCREEKAKCDAFIRQLQELLPGFPEEAWADEIRRRFLENEEASQVLAGERNSARTRDARRRKLNDELVPEARKSLDAVQKNRAAADTAVRTAESGLITAENEVRSAALGLLPDDWTILDLSDAVSKNDSVRKQAEREADAARADQDRLSAIEQETAAMDAALKKAQEDLHQAGMAEAQMEAEFQGIQRETSSLRRNLPYASAGECRDAIHSKTALKKKYEDETERLRENVQSLQISLAGSEGEIRTLSEDLKDAPEADLDALNRDLAAAEAAWQAAAGKEKEIHARKVQNDHQRTQLAEQAGLAGSLEKEYAMMQDVCDTVRGNISGNHIPLETYVQTEYFDRILGYANQRLIHMSRQQYDLARQSVEDGSRRGKTGLELDVVDHANGQRRAVGTLSGGESFLASLAFALGMSDAIQASAASAVRLETMFVDEGFGSLSENYLNLVMEELNDTASAGRRLIGIISHVDEVKDSVDRRIEVTKSANGISRAVIR